MPKKDQILTKTQRRNISISEQNIIDLMEFGAKDPLDPEQEIKNYSLIGVTTDSFGRRRCLELLKFEDIEFDMPFAPGVYQFIKEEKYNPPRRKKEESYAEYKKRKDKFEEKGLKDGDLRYTTHKGEKKLVRIYLGFITKETRDYLFGLRLIYKSGYVFRKDADYGEGYYGSSLDRWIKRIITKANKVMLSLGMPKSRMIEHSTAKDRELYLHIFRSAGPKLLIKKAKGLPQEKQILIMQTIQKQLGHSNFQYTVDLYGQETDEATAENLSLIWGNK